MASTYHSLHVHIVFGTKDRLPLIRKSWRDELHAYLGGTIRGLDGIPEAIGGTGDHVHVLAGLKTTHCPSDFVREVKKASSAWIRAHHEPSFAWQGGYGAFSISPTHRAALRAYIANQEAHHQQVSPLDELKRLLRQNGVDYDPQYLA